MCEKDGSLARITPSCVRAIRRQPRFFERPAYTDEPLGLAPELPVYMAALASLLERRRRSRWMRDR